MPGSVLELELELEPTVPTHGVDNWLMVDFDWNDKDGRATLRYERQLSTGLTERRTVHRQQPTNPTHEGWLDERRGLVPYTAQTN